VIPVLEPCADCRGCGGFYGINPAFPGASWFRCRSCDGVGKQWARGAVGKQWARGAPSFGCEITLADRDAGEIVTLGNGDRVKLAWHQPRKSKKVRPDTTFVLEVDEFTDREHPTPVPYPSCIGVATVDVSRATKDRDAHDGDRVEDTNDPLQRPVGALL
jgi:hypothetical protein